MSWLEINDCGLWIFEQKKTEFEFYLTFSPNA
jgi:hypothetical protein